FVNVLELLPASNLERAEAFQFERVSSCIVDGNRYSVDTSNEGASYSSENEANVFNINGRNMIEVPASLISQLKRKLITPNNVAIQVPELIEAALVSELERISVTAVYSDGSAT